MNEDLDSRPPIVRTVVKVGGAAFRGPHALAPLAEALATAGRDLPILVVPGGGGFADRVREIDREFGLTDSAAHWMAVAAMDQSAFLLADQIRGATIVTGLGSISTAIEGGRIPVLAPSTWLAACDPLPHSWDVTSDSIAAWMAGQVGARRLVLVKPGGVDVVRSPGGVPRVVDGYFSRALPGNVAWEVVPVDDIAAVLAAVARTTD